jgi:hypothetical protein
MTEQVDFVPMSTFLELKAEVDELRRQLPGKPSHAPPRPIIDTYPIREFKNPLGFHLVKLFAQEKTSDLWIHEVHIQFPRCHRSILFASKNDITDEAEFKLKCKDMEQEIFDRCCSY